MIPTAFIIAWRKNAPWIESSQVEQDLIIERSLVEIFKDPFLKEHLAFRGGIAMHKFFMKPQPRYSEDIDLVQIRPKPIKETINQIQKQLPFFEKADHRPGQLCRLFNRKSPGAFGANMEIDHQPYHQENFHYQ